MYNKLSGKAYLIRSHLTYERFPRAWCQFPRFSIVMSCSISTGEILSSSHVSEQNSGSLNPITRLCHCWAEFFLAENPETTRHSYDRRKVRLHMANAPTAPISSHTYWSINWPSTIYGPLLFVVWAKVGFPPDTITPPFLSVGRRMCRALRISN